MSHWKDVATRMDTSWGDLAEDAFLRLYGTVAHRMGLAEVSIDTRRWPATLRALPDFATATSFVEVQGSLGGDVRVKLQKVNALEFWDGLLPVLFFVWDSRNRRYAMVPLADLITLAVAGEHGRFHDGPPFRLIRASALEAFWKPFPEEPK